MSILINKKQNKSFKEDKKGFTLIELLVSIAIFSIVVVIILGAVISIVDSNRKARSLMTVMNNLNFTVDSITRSFKTGDIDNPISGISNGYVESSNSKCLTTTEIDYDNTSQAVNVIPRYVRYCITNTGEITKNGIALTSPDIEIDFENSDFKLDSQYGPQPFLTILLEGEVRITDEIFSSFAIQTSVSQRKLVP
jgi:prepilin-type N-terminal cleavage/methylation domain-containing protein